MKKNLLLVKTKNLELSTRWANFLCKKGNLKMKVLLF